MLGIIGLDTEFEKPRGHVRNPETFEFPITIAAIPGATTKRVVENLDGSFEQEVLNAARRLEQAGARMITSACGFLWIYQEAASSVVSVPVLLSSLEQIPLVARTLPAGAAVGVLTANQHVLTAEQLDAGPQGRREIHVDGMVDFPEFREVMLEQRRASLDTNRLRGEAVAAAQRLVTNHPSIAALVLECTDLAPHTDSIRRATGLPTYDHSALVAMLYTATTGGLEQ